MCGFERIIVCQLLTNQDSYIKLLNRVSHGPRKSHIFGGITDHITSGLGWQSRGGTTILFVRGCITRQTSAAVTEVCSLLSAILVTTVLFSWTGTKKERKISISSIDRQIEPKW